MEKVVNYRPQLLTWVDKTGAFVVNDGNSWVPTDLKPSFSGAPTPLPEWYGRSKNDASG